MLGLICQFIRGPYRPHQFLDGKNPWWSHISFLICAFPSCSHRNAALDRSALVCLQLVANAVLFASVNLSGVFVRILTERTQRKVFLQARNCIEERLRLEDENEKQVNADTQAQMQKDSWSSHLHRLFRSFLRFQVPVYSNSLPTVTQ